MEERRARVGPAASEYIRRQGSGSCLRDFMRQVFRPKPEELNLPGFNGRTTPGPEISWVAKGEEICPEPGKCCSALSCRASGSDLNAGDPTKTEKAAAQSRHHLILKLLRTETSTADGILGPAPGRNGVRCPKEERATFCTALEEWCNNHSESIRTTVPMPSRAWVLSECNVERLVDQLRRIVNTDKEKIDGKWVRALIDTAADDDTVGDLAAMIQYFHGGLFARPKEWEPQPSKQQKISGSTSQRRPPSPAESTFTQDSYLDPNYPSSQHYNANENEQRGHRQ